MEKQDRPIRVIAFYLPQYHPIPENDRWWGKGFTEWTNVGKARPLFKGHYQPRVPADLGYYDLRLPQIRIEQAQMAKKYGVEGFCYWHYWFGNGRRLLERPFKEVLESGQPDFPFCLGWANESWQDKQFSKEGTHRVLMEQLYPGETDYINHFHTVLPAFKDSRYIRVDDKPIFMIYKPFDLPNAKEFIELWQKLARENGLKGIHFIAHIGNEKDIQLMKEWGFDAVNIIRLFSFFQKDLSLFEKVKTKLLRIVFKRGRIVDYERAAKFFTNACDRETDVYPTIIPNWDHSPRSYTRGHILINSTPQKFKKHILQTFANVTHKEYDKRIVFLKSWNEWGEGNYMEPDLKFGLSYLEALKEALTISDISPR